MTSKTDKVDHKVQEVAPPNAWRIAAPRSCKLELQDRDEAFCVRRNQVRRCYVADG